MKKQKETVTVITTFCRLGLSEEIIKENDPIRVAEIEETAYQKMIDKLKNVFGRETYNYGPYQKGDVVTGIDYPSVIQKEANDWNKQLENDVLYAMTPFVDAAEAYDLSIGEVIIDAAYICRYDSKGRKLSIYDLLMSISALNNQITTYPDYLALEDEFTPRISDILKEEVMRYPSRALIVTLKYERKDR